MDFSLIETMRWEPGAGFLRLEQHLRRLSRSADALGFLPPPPDLLGQLEAAADGEMPLRIRLVMSYRGKIEIVTAPFTPVSEGTVWRLRLARSAKLASDDPLYRHKTSRREPYEAARAEFSPEDADEVLLLNERGEVCEGTITNVFLEDAGGTLLTPPLSSGLLPGILRAELIRERKARGHVLKPGDLANGRLFVGNSLRGLIPAELVGD